MAAGEISPPLSTPAPESPGRKKMLVLVLVAVLVVAALAAVVYVILSQPTPPTVALDRVEVSPSTATLEQMGKIVVTATAFDTKGVDQTANATFNWTSSPAGALLASTPGVPYIAQVTAVQSGSSTLTATAKWKGAEKSAQLPFTVAALHFGFTIPNLFPEVDKTTSLKVSALRANGSVAMTYQGRVNFTANDYSAISLPPDSLYLSSNQGEKTFSIVITKPVAVAVTVKDTVAPITGTITLQGNQKPVPDFRIIQDATDHRKISVDAALSTDPDGDALTYAWDFGDKTATVSGPTASHTYASVGDYTIKLTATDNHSAQDFATKVYKARAPPTVSFSVEGATPSGPDINITVNATASYSNNPGGRIAWYNWSWGDGNTSSVTTPVTYWIFGSYWADKTVTIVLNATDNESAWATFSRAVLVTVTPLPPVADFTATVDNLTRSVTVDGRASYDPNGNLQWYNWSWGDGTWSNGTLAVTTHVYPRSDNYTITLVVQDTTLLTGSASRTVWVQQPALPPTAAFSVVRNLFRVDVNATASSDPNGDIASYTWNWGDGSPPETFSMPLASHTYAAPNAYTINLTVTDSTNKKGYAERRVSVAGSTLDYTYYDFFNVPFGEWWDYRFSKYGDLPINAECFNQTSIGDGVCTRIRYPAVPDYETYPYTNWYPLPGAILPGNPNNNPMIYAPYRFSVTGAGVPGYNLSEPVFLPVLNYSAPRGNQLDFNWYLQYLDKAGATALQNAGCGRLVGGMDGYIVRSQISLTMDLQESKRIFGVPIGATAGDAVSWWTANTNPLCLGYGSVEDSVELWLTNMGNGKYDIVNSYEYEYTPFFTQIAATVDPDGTTHVSIDHVAWGTEVLLARTFYWGNASYQANYLDSTKAKGWWGMELAWFEDFKFQGSLGASTFDFNLNSVMQYQFQQLVLPGPNGIYDKTDDVPYWTWGPILSDYTNDYTPTHLLSELDRYPWPTYSYVHSTPGSPSSFYGQAQPYDYVPVAWNLNAGQTWQFQFPTGNVVFYDPNLTPPGADPLKGEYVAFSQTLRYNSTQPAGFGTWNAQAFTWDVYGPAATGGPVGSPGQYPLESWGAITFVASNAVLRVASAFSATLSVAPSDSSGAFALQESSPSVQTTTPFEPAATPARSEPALSRS